MSFPRYPEYKGSGVEWLDEIPAHWQINRLRHVARLVTDPAGASDDPVALENIESWTGRLLKTESKFEGTGIAFKKGDVLFGKLRPYLAKVTLASRAGAAIGDFHVLRPRAEVDGRFFQLVLLNKSLIDTLDGSTIGAKMPRVNWSFLANVCLAIPPPTEQALIMQFLEEGTAKIDALIQEQQRLIELLKEKLQAVISHAVTKGLDSVPMKHSGNEWIGNIPARWVSSRLGSFAELITTGPFGTALKSDEYVDGGVPVINPSHMANGGIVPDSSISVSPETADRLRFWTLQVGDVVLARRGELGRAAVVESAESGWICGTGSMRVQLRQSLTPRLLVWSFRSDYAKAYFERASIGATMPSLNEQTIREFPVAFPATLAEQRSLVSALTDQTEQIQRLISMGEQTISLLQERRSALISAAVTGKIDVRNFAPKPAETLEELYEPA